MTTHDDISVHCDHDFLLPCSPNCIHFDEKCIKLETPPFFPFCASFP